MTWNTVITHMYAKNIPVKVKRCKQTERRTNKQIQTIAVPCLVIQSVIKTTISLCSASYGGCKCDTARICCWLPCCCGYGLKGGRACCRRAVQQSIDIAARRALSNKPAARCCSRWIIIYFASAAVAVDSSHMTASSSTSLSRFSPPSNAVNGHVSTMWFMVCCWPQSQKVIGQDPINAS